MKEKLLLISLLVSSMSFATSVTPNTYTCAGVDIDVTYSTTSRDGTPRFTITPKREKNFSEFSVKSALKGKEEISVQELGGPVFMGTLVTVNPGGNPDAEVVTFSLLVPADKLEDRTKTATFHSMLIKGLNGIDFGGKPTFNRWLSRPLYCEAKVLDY